MDTVNYILNDTIRDCRRKHFRSFENRSAHNIKFKKLENNEEVVLTTILG